jgi:hypothetical protein
MRAAFSFYLLTILVSLYFTTWLASKRERKKDICITFSKREMWWILALEVLAIPCVWIKGCISEMHKNSIVLLLFRTTSRSFGFRRTFNYYKYNLWLHLCQRLMSIQLSNEPHTFVWNLNKSCLFSVKFMYLDLMNGHTGFLRKYLWKIKIPLKIRFSCGF